MTSLTIQLSLPTSEVKPIATSTTFCPIRTQTLGVVNTGSVKILEGHNDVVEDMAILSQSSFIGRCIRTDVFTYQST